MECSHAPVEMLRCPWCQTSFLHIPLFRSNTEIVCQICFVVFNIKTQTVINNGDIPNDYIIH